MTIENLMTEIENAKREKASLEQYLKERNRIDVIKVHFKKTHDILDNHGCPCADDAFSLQYEAGNDIFLDLRNVFLKHIDNEHKKVSDELAKLEQKKKDLERVLNS